MTAHKRHTKAMEELLLRRMPFYHSSKYPSTSSTLNLTRLGMNVMEAIADRPFPLSQTTDYHHIQLRKLRAHSEQIL
jgi:hypothetical protein